MLTYKQKMVLSIYNFIRGGIIKFYRGHVPSYVKAITKLYKYTFKKPKQIIIWDRGSINQLYENNLTTYV